MLTISLVIVIAAVLVPLLLRKLWCDTVSPSPRPPGPRQRWLIGNLLDMPKTTPWKTYGDWCTVYGDVLYLSLPTRPVLMLGSVQAARDLLESRSNIYSSRARSVMRELVSWNWSLPSMAYGPQWRATRRHFHQHFSGSAILSYQAIQLQEARSLLVRMLERPDMVRKLIRSLPGSTIMRVVYGAHTSQTEEYVELADLALESARRMVVPGAFLAELLPILQYIPAWMPGGTARKFAAFYKPIVQQMRDKPFDEVRKALAAGRDVPSVALNLIKQLQSEHKDLTMTPDQDTLARNVTGVAYAGAAATTTAAVESFMLAMALFPEVQKKAQAELDAQIGSTRLPDFNDLKSLTYLSAVVMETLRWMPSAPLGVPHCLSEDDEYRGYSIPKGTMVVANIWAMLHDPTDYPEPETFNPDRFIGSNGEIDHRVRDPTRIAFGFGRRICPGSDYALSVITICVASVLHVFDISPGFDEFGQALALSAEASSEAISCPVDFPRCVVPRSPQAKMLLRDVASAQLYEKI